MTRAAEQPVEPATRGTTTWPMRWLRLPIARVGRLEIDRRTGDRHAARRARRAEQLTERIVLLVRVGSTLERADEVLGHGWVRGAWIVPKEEALDPARRVTSPEAVGSACLVASIVLAAAAPGGTASPLVGRAVGVTWQAVFRGPTASARWLTAPAETAGQIADLVAWNDAQQRTVAEVRSSVRTAARLVDEEVVRLRSLLLTTA